MSSEADAAATVSARLTALLERISVDYLDGPEARLAAAAREEFLTETGRVHEGDPAFDNRMAQFMEWFLLDRPLTSGEATPCECYVRRHRDALSPEQRRDLLALGCSHRSLFTLAARQGSQRFVIDDLLYGMRWLVTDSEGLPGLGPNDVFEARLVGFSQEVHFTAAFCYHPGDVAQRVRRYVEQRSDRVEQGSVVLAELMTLRLAYDRADGCPATDIYRFEG